MKVLVGFPPTQSPLGTPLLSQNRQFQYFEKPTFLYPVVLGTAATMVKKAGHEVIWRDAIAEDMNWDEYDEMLEKEKPDIFLFETKAPVVKKHWKSINHMKEKFPNMKIVICGDHVSYLPRETLENSKVDYVINGGYYDFAFIDLVNWINEGKGGAPEGVWYRKDGEIVENGRFEFHKDSERDINDAPFPDRELTKYMDYQDEFNLKGRPQFYIMSARDCAWGKCTFCVWDHALYPKGAYKQRTPENTFAEVKHLVDNFGAKEIFDDAGTIPPGKWLEKFCNLMIESGYNKKVMYSCNMRFGWVDREMYKLMKGAGFRLLKYGLESGCQKTIDKLDKGVDVSKVFEHCKDAKDAGLVCHLTMMTGYPWETKNDAMKTFNLAKKLMTAGLVDIHQSTVVMPYPGTPLYEEAVREGWLRFEKDDYEKLAMDQPAMKTIEMSPEEVQGLCKLNYRIYLDPKYIWQHAKSRIKSWEDIKYTFEGLTAVFGHMRDFSRKPERKGDKELLTEEQVERMLANLHNPRQDLVAIKAGAKEPIPHRKIEEVEAKLPVVQ
ncbi:B12-binding domain-containing radical SAM protein [Candidatus Pacearchaeota archaeon]|nr:B12-binding domain-containing radical SAM protein [Candidatus Pacearchaeota archaeon]